MDVVVTGCTGNTKVLWFGHACSGYRKLWEHARVMVWAWMFSGPDALGTRKLLWFWHACSGYCTLWQLACCYGLGMHALVIVSSWKHDRYSGSGMDALVLGCTQNTNVFIPLPPPHSPTQSSETSQNRVRKSSRLLKQGALDSKRPLESRLVYHSVSNLSSLRSYMYSSVGLGNSSMPTLLQQSFTYCFARLESFRRYGVKKFQLMDRFLHCFVASSSVNRKP